MEEYTRYNLKIPKKMGVKLKLLAEKNRRSLGSEILVACDEHIKKGDE